MFLSTSLFVNNYFSSFKVYLYTLLFRFRNSSKVKSLIRRAFHSEKFQLAEEENSFQDCLKKIQEIYNVTPYPSQIETAIMLSKGFNVELPTGEGKTLALLMASFLSLKKFRKVIVLTVNEYLVRREYQ